MGAAVLVALAAPKAEGPKGAAGGPNPPPAPDKEACLVGSSKGEGGGGGPCANPMGLEGNGGVVKLRGGNSDAVLTGVLPPVDVVFKYKAPEGGVPTKKLEGLLPNRPACPCCDGVL